jgi:ATP-dependent Clp protease, protease subunit
MTIIKPFFAVVNKGNTPTIYIDGIIGDNYSYTDFRTAFANIVDSGAKRVKIIINSAGGDMSVGFAIYDMLVTSGLYRDVEIVGMAASMAGVISQAASPGCLAIHSNAVIMTHKAHSGAKGESDMLRAMADFSDKLEARAVSIYRDRTKAADAVVKSWFKAGTMKWFNAEESIVAGLADFIITSEAKPPKVSNQSSISDIMLCYNSIIPKDQSQNTKLNMKKVLMVLSNYKVNHALTEESTDEQVSLVVENALKAQADKIVELQGKLDQQNKTTALNLVENAIKDGKIKAEAKDKYVIMATENFDLVKDIFDGLQGRVDPKALIIPVTSGVAPVAESSKAQKTFNQYSEKELRDLKATNLDAFKALFKAEYGSDYEG